MPSPAPFRFVACYILILTLCALASALDAGLPRALLFALAGFLGVMLLGFAHEDGQRVGIARERWSEDMANHLDASAERWVERIKERHQRRQAIINKASQ